MRSVASWLWRRSTAVKEKHTLSISAQQRRRFGDVLWYFVTLCRRLCIDLDTVFPKFTDGITVNAANYPPEDQRLLNLGKDGGGIA